MPQPSLGSWQRLDRALFIRQVIRKSLQILVLPKFLQLAKNRLSELPLAIHNIRLKPIVGYLRTRS